MNTNFTNTYNNIAKNIIKLPTIDLSDVTNATNVFYQCSKITSISVINTSRITNTGSMFNNCTNLTTVPQFNANKVTTMQNMFTNVKQLSNESLNNILGMCIGATSYSGAKTLYTLGFRSSQYPVATIEALPNYQDFLDTGWTIGY